MSKYSPKDQTYMVNVAKNAIRSELYAVPLKLNPIPPKLKEKRACFVTLTRIGQLRGCIGHILPVQELYKDIIENSKAAAFEDPRFSPVTEKELADLTIEISVLTIPKPFSYHTHEELLHYLGKRKPGVILSKGSAQATFLPAVWDDIHDPQVFLTHLSLKAGLGSDEWKHGVTIQCYRAEKITA